MEKIYGEYNFCYDDVLVDDIVLLKSKQIYLPICFPESVQKLIKQWILWLWRIDRWNKDRWNNVNKILWVQFLYDDVHIKIFYKSNKK